MKTIQGPIGNTLSKIKAIRGVIWTPNEFAQGVGMGTQPRYGVIAEEVQAQFPELTFRLSGLPVEDDYRGVDYSKFSAVLVEAIKELDTKITAIENQVNSGS